MKGKVTSLVLVGGAFAVAALTQDGSPNLHVGSRLLTALITTAWFVAMGTGLYFWARYTRQKTPQDGTHPTQANENMSLKQLATALEHDKTAPVTETIANHEKAVGGEATQESSG